MSLFDTRTLVFSDMIIHIVCLLVILFLWRQGRKRFAGLGYWVSAFAFQTIAFFLIFYYSNIPNWMSMVLGRTFMITGSILGYIGLGRFVGRRTSQTYNYILLALFVPVQIYFALIQPNLAVRNLIVSIGLLIIYFQCTWLLIYKVEPGMRRLTLGVGVVFGIYGLFSIGRIVEVFITTHGANDLFQSGAFQSLVFLSFQVLLVLLTYGLVLMVNKRLLAEVTIQEEKFAKAFQSSPYAVTLARLSDGEMIEVNDGFSNITGYQYAEAIGRTVVDLGLWDKDEDRLAVVDELSKSGKVQGKELQFRKKSGEVFTGLLWAEIISINKQEFVLSSVGDISEPKRMERELRRSRDELEMRVRERTEELQATNEALKTENEERLKVEIDLRESEHRLRELSTALLSAQEKERKLIAAEIHDSLGASLAATKFKVQDALKQIDGGNPQTRVALESVIPIIQGTMDEARRIQMSLRPSMLDDLGILTTVNWLCRQFESTYPNICIKKEIGIQENEVPESLKIVIYRLLQEALNNIAKHSKALTVLLSLQKTKKEIRLVIRDSGQGFDLEEAYSRQGTTKGLGLDSMRERIELSGGFFSIESSRGAGTVIQATWLAES